MRATRLCLLIPALLALGAVSLVGPSASLADDHEESVRQKIERIHRLEAEARALQEEGKADLAHALRQRAEALEDEVRAIRKERELDRVERQEAVEDEIETAAKQGIDVLRRLLAAAGEEDADGAGRAIGTLLEIVRGLEGTEPDKDPDAPEAHYGHVHGAKPAHREETEHAAEMLRAAMKAFREIEAPDLVEMLERALHVHELLKTGAVDEAQRFVKETGLERDVILDLLRRAAGLYHEWGREEIAAQLRELAERGHGGRSAKREEHAGTHGGALERIRQMEEKVEVILHMAATLREELQGMRRELERAR